MPGVRCRGDALHVLAGAAAAVAGTGAVLALSGSNTPLRAPFGLFFLVAAPAAGLAAALRRLEPATRTVLAVTGAVAVDLLVAAVMTALHMWSVRGAVAAVAALSVLLGAVSGVRRGKRPRT
ncbi:hypothetical protein ACIRD2_21270 [Streptomyces sp. NPDC093595]|uniref:hypothetical protein n=1 Tax=Streptomyces sp. NPDC093595 TaxID=3366045 RepID=UPI003818B1D1